MNEQVFIKFEDGSDMKIDPNDISRLCFDLRSWFQVMRMLAGYCEFAIMTICPDRREEHRVAVSLTELPYDWKFPETA